MKEKLKKEKEKLERMVQNFIDELNSNVMYESWDTIEDMFHGQEIVVQVKRIKGVIEDLKDQEEEEAENE